MSNYMISVMVPVYNQQDFLPACLDSLLQQDFCDFEVMLAIDGATDSSLSICQKYAAKDPRFIIINHEINRGLSFIRADTLPRACGKYVALLDPDDVAHPQRLSRQVAFLENNPDVVLLGSYVGVIDGNGKEIGNGIMPTTDIEIRWRLTFGNCLASPSLMFRSDAAMHCGGFDATLLTGEDMEFSSRVLTQGKAAVIPEKLAYWRTHENNMQKTESAFKKQELVRSVRKSIRRHLDLEVSEELAALVFANTAASQELFEAALTLLVRAVRIFADKYLVTETDSSTKLGRIAFISLFELAARNRRQPWWPACENAWLTAAHQITNTTGYRWNRDFSLLGELHPRGFFWKLFAKTRFIKGGKQ